LGGAKRLVLLVLQPAHIEMVINLKTSAALGLALPMTCLLTQTPS
jgi:hypothetical protein